MRFVQLWNCGAAPEIRYDGAEDPQSVTLQYCINCDRRTVTSVYCLPVYISYDSIFTCLALTSSLVRFCLSDIWHCHGICKYMCGAKQAVYHSLIAQLNLGIKRQTRVSRGPNSKQIPLLHDTYFTCTLKLYLPYQLLNLN